MKWCWVTSLAPHGKPALLRNWAQDAQIYQQMDSQSLKLKMLVTFQNWVGIHQGVEGPVWGWVGGHGQSARLLPVPEEREGALLLPPLSPPGVTVGPHEWGSVTRHLALSPLATLCMWRREVVVEIWDWVLRLSTLRSVLGDNHGNIAGYFIIHLKQHSFAQ